MAKRKGAPFVAVRTDIRKEERIRFIADFAGYNDDEAIGKLVRMWSWCTDRGLEDAPNDCEGYAVPDAVVRRFMGPRGLDALLGDGCDELAMGERRPDGLIYLRGTAETVGRLRSLRALATAGGNARHEHGWRVAGRFVSKPTDDEPSGEQPIAGGDVVSDTNHPATRQPDPQPAPARSQIPDPRSDQNLSPARAIQPTPVPPGESAWHRRQRWWGAMLEADKRLRLAGIEPNAPSLAKAPAGEVEKDMNRCEQDLIASGYDAAIVDEKMRHIVLVAEAESMREQHRRWFKPAMIWDPKRAARAVDTTLDEARRKRQIATGPSKPPAAAPPRPDPGPAPIVRTSDERAAAAAELAKFRATKEPA